MAVHYQDASKTFSFHQRKDLSIEHSVFFLFRKNSQPTKNNCGCVCAPKKTQTASFSSFDGNNTMDVDARPSGDEDKNPTFKFTEGRERKQKVKNPACSSSYQYNVL